LALRPAKIKIHLNKYYTMKIIKHNNKQKYKFVVLYDAGVMAE